MLILVIPYSHTVSHVSRPLMVALELNRRRGHEIVFAGESPALRFAREAGFETVPLHEPDPAVLYGAIREGRLRFVSNDELERMIDADLALIREIRPDLVLTDGRFSAMVSTQIARVRHAAIVNVSSTAYRAVPYVPLFDRIPAQGALRRFLDRLNLRIEMLVFDRVMSSFTRLSRRYRLPVTVTATNCLTGAGMTLLPDSPRYFPTVDLPANYHYVGPLILRTSTPPPPWWGDLAARREPVIYLTMGSTGVPDFFVKVDSLLRDLPCSLVIATAGSPCTIPEARGGLFVTDFIDGDLIMGISSAVVCHGGNGTVYQALSHGCPLLCIPTIPDQAFNGRRVEALGLGRSIPWETCARSPRLFREIIEDLITNRELRKRVDEFAGHLKEFSGERRAADILERFVRETSA